MGGILNILEKHNATQPKLQRTWLRQGDKRREKLSLIRVKVTSGAKSPSR